YYVVMGTLVFLLFHFVPYFDQLLSGEHVNAATDPSVLKDLMDGGKIKAVEVAAQSRTDLALTTVLVMISTIVVMLPVSWVFMSVRRTRDSTQHLAQTLIILPLVVAGMVLVVRS